MRDGVPIGAHHAAALRGAGRSRSSRSRCWRRSRTRPSSPSRTPGCSRSWSSATATSERGTGAADGHWRGAARHRLVADRRAARARHLDCQRDAPLWSRVRHHPPVGRPPDHVGRALVRAVPARGRSASAQEPGRTADIVGIVLRPRHPQPPHPPRARRGSRRPHRVPGLASDRRLGPAQEPDLHAAHEQGRADWHHGVAPSLGGTPVHRPADRAAGNLRRPGRHRHRERPPVRGAGAAQRRARTRRSISRQPPPRPSASSPRRPRICQACSTPSSPAPPASATPIRGS